MTQGYAWRLVHSLDTNPSTLRQVVHTPVETNSKSQTTTTHSGLKSRSQLKCLFFLGMVLEQDHPQEKEMRKSKISV